MGLKRFRGTVNTVETAALDHRILTVTCQRCSRSRNIWAYRAINTWPEKARSLPLGKAVDGFYCKGCKQPVQVYIGSHREGEF